jgi:hypothetical protein
MIRSKKNDPKHWQDRAAQMRALALTMGDPRAAALMNDLAAHYDNLADATVARPNDGKLRRKGKTSRLDREQIGP